jgi:hypothetical protein
MLQWLNHFSYNTQSFCYSVLVIFQISSTIFDISSARYSDSSVLLQCLSHFVILSAIFEISSCSTVTHPSFATMTQLFSDSVMPRCSDSVILWYVSLFLRYGQTFCWFYQTFSRFHLVIPMVCSVICIIFNLQSNPYCASVLRYMDGTFDLNKTKTIRQIILISHKTLLLSYPIFMPKLSTHRMHDPG